MKKIPIGKNGQSGKFALVDDEDYDRLMKIKWYFNNGGYAINIVKPGKKNGLLKFKHTLMHRLVLNTPEGFDTDHINGDKLDNRKENLRICEHNENMRNQKVRQTPKSSKYNGVTLNKESGKYRAYIVIDRKYCHLGVFNSAIEAAKAYNAAAIKHFGEFYLLNVI